MLVNSVQRASLRCVAAALLFLAKPAVADVTSAECVAANASGQTLRREGKFKAAREQLRACNDPLCPSVVSEDCTRRLDELEAAQPTIVFDAKDATLHDLLTVTVKIDGHPFAAELDGTPLQVDRGEHTFTFTAGGEAPVTETLVIKESEKARRYQVVVGGARPVRLARPVLAEDPPAAAAPSLVQHGATRSRWVPLIVGGAGVGLLIVGSAFGVMTANGIREQVADCASSTSCAHPSAAAAAHSSWATDGAISTAAFVAGGVLVASGVGLLLSGHRSFGPATGLVLTPSVRHGGGSLLLQGKF